jgi:flagellar motor component MotA
MMFGLIDLVSFLFVISMTAAVSISSGLSRAQSALAEALPEMGVIGMYLGLLMMLHNMDDPNAIFPAFAIACLPVLYTSIIGFVMQNLGSTPEHDQLGTVSRLRYPSLILVLVTLYLCARGELALFFDLQTLVLTSLFIVVGIGLQRRQGKLDPAKTRALFPTIGLIIGAMGIVLALSNFSNPKAIGPAMAMAFLGVLYTSVIRLMWIIIQPGMSSDQESAVGVSCAPWRTLMGGLFIWLMLLSFAEM